MPPRLYHQKSKTGCQLCRRRRVKCDETRPRCSKCKTHDQECIYDRSPRSAGSVAIKRSPQSIVSPISAPAVNSPPPQPAFEDKERRLLELQLMSYFAFDVCNSLPVVFIDEVRRIWSLVVARLATRYDTLLNAIMTLSLRHMLCTGNEEVAATERLRVLHGQYLEATLEEYKTAVGTLTPVIADAASFTSVLLSMDAFASLRDRDLAQYTAPVQWLHLCKGVTQVFGVALRLLRGHPDALIHKVVETSGSFVKHANFMPASQFPALFTRRPGESDEDDAAYVETASYLSAIRSAQLSGEPMNITIRRFIVYPVVFPTRFVELLGEHQPRALVVLAHYFALAVSCEKSAWVGDAPRKEIIAMAEFLPSERLHGFAWPLSVVRQPNDMYMEEA